MPNRANELTKALVESARSIASDRKVAKTFHIDPATIQSWFGRRPGFRHRQTESPEYTTWRGMKRRCLSPRATNYRWYGARGISLCERWKDFRNFLADMGKKPKASLTIERIDNAKGYEPGNCRWATRKEQCITRRTPWSFKKGAK